MSLLTIELQKEKRTGVIPVLIVVGILGAAYALVNFFVRKNTLLSLPLAPMDVLLTQLYGTLLILNMFGIIVATCMIYNMEFKGNAVKKLYNAACKRPQNVPVQIFDSNNSALIAITLQNLALIKNWHDRFAAGYHLSCRHLFGSPPIRLSPLCRYYLSCC